MSKSSTELLGSFITEYSVKNKDGADIPVYSVSNEKGFCRDYFSKDVSSKDKTSYKIVPRGCFAYNPSRINVGSIAWQDKEDAVIVSPLYVVFSTEGLNNDFLMYYLKSNALMSYIKIYSAGSVRNNLRFKTLSSFPVKVPSLEQQARIVAELDCLTDIIERKRQQLEELNKLAQSIFYEMFGDPVVNKKGFDIVKMSNICDKIADGVHSKPNYTTVGVPFISVVNINTGKLVFDGCKYVSRQDYEFMTRKTRPEKDDILYTKVGATYGIPALVDTDKEFCLYVSVCLLKVKKELVLPKFLVQQMALPFIKYQADDRISGIGVPDLHLNQIGKFSVLLPPLDLQNEFAKKIEAIDKQKELVKRSIVETETLFNSRMDFWFNN